MPSPFGDDEQFPDRPDTLDFWRLSETVMQFDGGANEQGLGLEEIAQGRIDLDSLNYMAEGRARLMISKTALPPHPHLIAALHAMFTTAVLTGIEFERKGGHR